VALAKKTKKRKKEKKDSGKLAIRPDHPRRRVEVKVCTPGGLRCVVLYFKLYQNGSVVLPLWVVENCPSPLLWPLAYTTACTTVQAVIVYCSVLWLKTASKAKSCRCILVSYDQNFYGAINSLSLSLSV